MEQLLAACACGLLGTLFLLYYIGTRKHHYWSKRGIVGPNPVPFFGTQKDIQLSILSNSEFYRKLYEDYPSERFVGLLDPSKPLLMIRSPEDIKRVVTSDFEYFPDRSEPYNEEEDPVTAHLFNIEGACWKNIRNKLTPTFTAGKMKRMFPLMMDITKELEQVLDDPASREEVVEMKDVLGRFATDVIGSCAFGINCNSLRDPNAEFHKHGMEFFATSFINKLRLAIFTFFPKVAFLHKLLKHASLNKFILGLLKETFDHREKSNIKRGDFVDLLIEIKNHGEILGDKVHPNEKPFLDVPISTSPKKFKFTENLMAAQAFVFFAAGFNTTSNTISFCVLELANNPHVQKRVQADIDSAIKRHGGVTYDSLAEMCYLDKTLSETLRKYPPGAQLHRKCIKPYKMPNTELVVEPNTIVVIPVAGLHYDPDIYPDPECFDPERFSPEARATRHPYTYLPFGEGPRNCIGMRFGWVESKLALATLLSRYEFKPSPLTKYPIKYKGGTFVTENVDGCNVYIRKRADVGNA